MIQAILRYDNLLSAILGSSLAAFVAAIFMMWMEPIPVASFVRYAEPAKVQQDGRITVRATVERTAVCDSIVTRMLIAADGRMTLFTPEYVEALPVGSESYTISIAVPLGTVEGPIRYRVRTEWRCNFVQRFLGGPVMVLPDVIFEYHRNKGET